MLTFLPLLLLFALLIILQIISRSRLIIGNQWLILVFCSLLVWGSLILLRFHFPQPVTLKNWFPAATDFGSLTFQLDLNSWVIIYALVTLLAGMVFTESVSLQEKADLREWSGLILLIGLGVLGSLVDSVLGFILSWALLDVIDLFIKILDQENETPNIQFIFILFCRFVGTALVTVAMIMNSSHGRQPALVQFQGTDLALMITGAFLRMAFIPEPQARVNSNSVMAYTLGVRQILPSLLALTFLSRLSSLENYSGFLVLLFLIVVFVTIYCSVRCFIQPGSSKGITLWVGAFSGMAMISVLTGRPESAIYWGLLMVLVIGWLWEYAQRSRQMSYFLVILVLALIGLPFSSSNLALTAGSNSTFSGADILLWICLALLVVALIRQAMTFPELQKPRERWMNLFYMGGMAFLSIAPWLPGLWQIKGWKILAAPYVPLGMMAVVALLIVLTLSSKGKQWVSRIVSPGMRTALGKTSNLAKDSFELNWFFRFVVGFTDFLRRIIRGLNNILEGEGGLLWAFVFLALLISILITMVRG